MMAESPNVLPQLSSREQLYFPHQHLIWFPKGTEKELQINEVYLSKAAIEGLEPRWAIMLHISYLI